MIYKDFYDLTYTEKEQFLNYLKSVKEQSSSPAVENMYHDDWDNLPHTLPYILGHTGRFYGESGQFHILYDNNKVVACGGVYKSFFDSKIALAGVRTYVDVKYRHNSILREHLLPIHKRWAIENNCDIVGLSFNEYNKNIIEIFKRRRLGESLDRMIREPHMLFYNGLNELDYPVNIQNTKQYIIYETLNEYTYDWEQIKWV
jgi:hypothetical protein